MPSRTLLLSALLVLLVSPPADAFVLYHSPADDGVNPAAPGVVPIGGGSKTLYLYVDNGSSATPSDPCAGTGVGDEICMWDLNIVCDPGLTVVSFTGDPGASAVANPQAASLRVNGGEPLAGTLGSARVGELVVSATGTGDCSVVGEAWVDTGLSANGIPTAVVASACNDNDIDDLCNPVDPCIDFDNSGAGGLTDSDFDNIPDVCQCGDANGNNTIDNNDLTTIFGCLSAAIPPATCAANLAGGKMEANNNGSIDNNDLSEIFATLTAAQPQSALICANRPEGTPFP